MSRFLLDTHVFLWMHADPGRLGSARALLEDGDNELFLSAASAWEIAIKSSIGKLALPEPPGRYVADRLVVGAVTPMPVRHDHALAVADLPRHHNDPFDRLLIAQARIEGLPLITADEALRPYDVELVHIT